MRAISAVYSTPHVERILSNATFGMQHEGTPPTENMTISYLWGRKFNSVFESIPAASLQPSDHHERQRVETERQDAVEDPVRATQGQHSHRRLRRIRYTHKASAAFEVEKVTAHKIREAT